MPKHYQNLQQKENLSLGMACTREYVFSMGDILGSVPSTKKSETKIQNKQTEEVLQLPEGQA